MLFPSQYFDVVSVLSKQEALAIKTLKAPRMCINWNCMFLILWQDTCNLAYAILRGGETRNRRGWAAEMDLLTYYQLQDSSKSDGSGLRRELLPLAIKDGSIFQIKLALTHHRNGFNHSERGLNSDAWSKMNVEILHAKKEVSEPWKWKGFPSRLSNPWNMRKYAEICERPSEGPEVSKYISCLAERLLHLKLLTLQSISLAIGPKQIAVKLSTKI